MYFTDQIMMNSHWLLEEPCEKHLKASVNFFFFFAHISPYECSHGEMFTDLDFVSLYLSQRSFSMVPYHAKLAL